MSNVHAAWKKAVLSQLPRTPMQNIALRMGIPLGIIHAARKSDPDFAAQWDAIDKDRIAKIRK